MAVAFDPRKDTANIAKHGLSLSRAEDMEIKAVKAVDSAAHGEERFRAFGLIDGVAHCLVFTVRNGIVRAISLRRAHAREMKRHVR
jgi:uncharacterized DUF497 family protein